MFSFIHALRESISIFLLIFEGPQQKRLKQLSLLESVGIDHSFFCLEFSLIYPKIVTNKSLIGH